jgi:predicted peroxiredoxin
MAAYPEAGKSLLIHVTSLPKGEKDQFYAVPQLALTAMNDGYEVTILFDGKGVKLIKIGHWYGGDTNKLDKMKIPEEELKSLSSVIGLPASSLPGNYGDLMRLMKGRGVRLFASEKMMGFYGIGDDEYDFAVTLVNLQEMLNIIERADVYVSY